MEAEQPAMISSTVRATLDDLVRLLTNGRYWTSCC